MILPRTDSVSKPVNSPDQKPLPFSRLTKKELQEIHDASTHYPLQKQSAANVHSSSNGASHRSEQQSSKIVTTDLSVHVEKDTDCTEAQPAPYPLSDKGEETLNHVDQSQNSLTIPILDEDQKQDALHFYHEKEAFVDADSVSDDVNNEVDRDHLPSAASLVGGAAALIAQVKSFFQPQQPSLSLDDDPSLTSIAGMASKVSDESQSVSIRRGEMSLMEPDDPVTNDLDLQLDEQQEEVKNAGERAERSIFRNSEGRERISTTPDSGDDANFGGAEQEHLHEIANKMGEKENEGNNFMLPKTLITHPEVAPATGSSGSAEPHHSDPVAAALRVVHLLDELTVTVGRLRLESSDGKEMTIQLRRDVLADTNIHIVSTAKQMEVSFLTSNATSNSLLNTHLTTLQNHLNSLCPGQVVTVQTQLTPSSGSSHSGNEQERSRDDLASFDQRNRGNSSNDDDNL